MTRRIVVPSGAEVSPAPSAARPLWASVKCCDSGALRTDVHCQRLAMYSMRRRAGSPCGAVDPSPTPLEMRTISLGATRRPSAFAVGAAALLALHAGTCLFAEDLSSCSESSIAELRRSFGIEIVCSEHEFKITHLGTSAAGRPPNRIDAERYLPLLVRELSIYPKDLIKRSGLMRIVLSGELRYAGVASGGLATYNPPTIYLDASLPAEHARFQCATIHHELFHLLDYADDGIVGHDHAWSSFNPRGFKYGQPIINATGESRFGGLTGPGFLSAHSFTDAAEDKAEVFAHLIVNGSYVLKRAESDPWLRAKVIATKHALGALCSEIDEKFWEAAGRVQRTGPDSAVTEGAQAATKEGPAEAASEIEPGKAACGS
jgi:hypothetical protein